MANTQAETSQVDMIAIYSFVLLIWNHFILIRYFRHERYTTLIEEVKLNDNLDGSFLFFFYLVTVHNLCSYILHVKRSLLTQSPIVDFSPDNIVSIDKKTDSGSAEATTNPHLHTNGNSSSVHLNTDNSVFHINTNSSEANENRKRKLSFLHGDPLPIRNLEAEVFNNPEAAAKESTWQMDAFDDDAFYEGIDLDGLEEQAAKELRLKSELLNAKPKNQDLEFFDAPSFDLGF